MTVLQGTRYSDSDTYNIAVDMSPTLWMLDPLDVPTLNLIGPLSTPCVAVKHEWLEDAMRAMDGTLNGTELQNTTTSVTTMVVATGQYKYLRAGDVLQIGAEKIRVTATPTSESVSIVRHFAGTADESHASGAAWSIVAEAILQDTALGAPRTTVKTERYNYTQIYEDAIKITTTEEAIKKYVEQNEMPAQISRAMKACWKVWNRSLIRGEKVAPTATVGGTMDGILPIISSNNYTKTGQYLTEAFIRTAMRDSWTAGGNIDTILVNSFQREMLSSFNDAMRMTSRTDTVAGSVINTVTNEYGNARIVLDRDIPTDTVLLIEKSRIGFGPLTNHAMSAAPVSTGTRSYDAVQIFGQYTSETRNENAHAKITGLATS